MALNRTLVADRAAAATTAVSLAVPVVKVVAMVVATGTAADASDKVKVPRPDRVKVGAARETGTAVAAATTM